MIEHYEFGEIVIDGKKFTSDVILCGDRIDSNWWRTEGHELKVEDIASAIDRERPDVLVVGTGFFGRMTVLPETNIYARAEGIELIAEPTKQAVETYNSLHQRKKVLAALHLTC